MLLFRAFLWTFHRGGGGETRLDGDDRPGYYGTSTFGVNYAGQHGVLRWFAGERREGVEGSLHGFRSYDVYKQGRMVSVGSPERRLNMLLRYCIIASSLARLVSGLGEPRVISFPSVDAVEEPTTIFGSSGQKAFWTSGKQDDHFIIASKKDHRALPILLDSHDDIAIHIAASTFANDIGEVTGVTPKLHNDTLPDGHGKAIIVGSAGSRLVSRLGADRYDGLKGKWESYDVRIRSKPLDSVDEALVVVGSDRVSTACS